MNSSLFDTAVFETALFTGEAPQLVVSAGIGWNAPNLESAYNGEVVLVGWAAPNTDDGCNADRVVPGSNAPNAEQGWNANGDRDGRN